LAIRVDNLLRNSPSSRSSSKSPASTQGQVLTCPDTPEPMQIAYARISIEERERRRREGLCYYCGGKDHQNSACPNKGRRLPYSKTSVSNETLTPPRSHSFSLLIELSSDSDSKYVSALVDSGAALNLIHQDLVQELQIPTVPCIPAINVTAVNNAPIGTGITHQTVPLTLRIGLFHIETISISLYVINSPKHTLILGHPWLAVHDPLISWHQGELKQWSSYCMTNCLQVSVTMPCLTTSIESPENHTSTTIPKEY